MNVLEKPVRPQKGSDYFKDVEIGYLITNILPTSGSTQIKNRDNQWKFVKISFGKFK